MKRPGLTRCLISTPELRQRVPVRALDLQSGLGTTISFSVDAVKFGIETLAPKFFNGKRPDFVVSGSNVGGKPVRSLFCTLCLFSNVVNLGPGITGSGTV